MIAIELLVVLAAILLGARISGIGLGVMGGLGLAILVFIFGLKPTSAPIDVMLMIIAVITTAACLQAAGGMAFLVQIAEKILRRNPKRITFFAPLVTYCFTLFAGTGHVAYAVLPVIAEVAHESGVRPERPLSIAVIASQAAITASPISAATVALLALLSPIGIHLGDILQIAIPATLIGTMAGALMASRQGCELHLDPVYRERLERGDFAQNQQQASITLPRGARLSVAIFFIAVTTVVMLGSIPALRPTWLVNDTLVRLDMAQAIQIVMLSAAALMLMLCKVDPEAVIKSSVFRAGSAAVIGIFGVAWMGDTFIQNNLAFFSGSIQSIVTAQPWLFAVALFGMSILLYSQAATIRAMLPLGIALGLPAPALIAMFPSVNGYFFIPNYPTVIAAINFDRTGTTRIGKYLLNHSFMLPGLVCSITSVSSGFLLAGILL
ncbi:MULTISPECIES: anaerobic C4-dicarboxylate transporter family protein [Deefgea]|uniref:C4-dicarboxylate transporter n=1 Tax=Deefgea chitinilytica TaxID=570276 RepID=A0ABS2CEU3_9NEIS|nr:MULTISPECIES: anaerobic C4-dicarboxylate transporter [Deefgea]MBM5572664.1 anaerobic C4-dicarboxylate transporter [Deefgea chitinilytica]MBM9889900.1 anaerobic C4-dicarboxylate transporter [Deefgea sp. CFH1-16]